MLLFSYADDLDVFVPNDVPAPADLFALGAGFANALNGVQEMNLRDGPQMLWQGMVRSGRRRANGGFLGCMSPTREADCPQLRMTRRSSAEPELALQLLLRVPYTRCCRIPPP